MLAIILIVFDFENNNITVSIQKEIEECPDGNDGSWGFKTNNLIPSKALPFFYILLYLKKLKSIISKKFPYSQEQ